MKRTGRRGELPCETQLEQAQTRIEQAEERLEHAESSAELANARTELAEARTELAETRTALAENRAQHAEALLQCVVQKDVHVSDHGSSHPIKRLALKGIDEGSLDHLTPRQRQILQHIAEGQNTKQIAATLNLSPKTVEYHRAKLMTVLNVHDVPGLVRLAVRAGLVPAEV